MHRDVPDGLVGDANRLRQILLNLVGNAIKFTETGQVIVRVNVTSASSVEPQETAEQAVIGFEVKDTGIGISPELYGSFQAFEQADSSTMRRYAWDRLGTYHRFAIG